MKKIISSIAALTMSVCVLATNPCNKYHTDAKRFVAHGVGHARHINTAKIKAQMDANSRLTDDILLWVKCLTDQYITDFSLDPAEYSHIFDQISRQSAEEQINYASIICDKKGYEKGDMLSAYISLEIDRKTVFESFGRAFANDKRLSEVYDQGKFLALCKAEMEALKSGKRPDRMIPL